MWIIPNNYRPSSASVLDMVESKEDLNSQALNIESSLMWRSKPSPLRTWSQRWSRVTWFQHLSGRILKPSQHTSFETQLTSSLEGIRANRLAWQEGRLQQKNRLVIPDTYSPTSSTMCEQLDLLSASSRTSKDTSTGDSNQSSKTWKAQVTIQRGEYSQRRKLAHLTKGNASSFLPTPTATPYGNNQGGAAGRTGQVRHSLESMAKHDLWPTPTAMTGGTGVAPSHENGGHGWNIGAAVNDSLSDKPKRQWPTPRASGAMTDSTESVKKRLQKVGYEGKLEQAVRKWPVQHTDNEAQTSGTLNPTWVEWLMGLPTEWTDLDSWVTESSLKQRPEHGRS